MLYSDQGQSVKLDERQREVLFAQLKEEASFGGVDNQQDTDTSITQEARVYSISIASKDYRTGHRGEAEGAAQNGGLAGQLLQNPIKPHEKQRRSDSYAVF